ncbi:MAG: hypothetical protein A3E37_04110 [Candidatus Andersenbacteria bacterium RIFCSPHIGHO2_12_FULL_46_9]|nr:MAG: hypothetical protein A3E37_04110 [Candidatus Andersenbacteria bacterium RIFCSPHIGHO2_12_FULL_46_9]
MMIHKSRGGIMVLIVMLVAILAILLPVWLSVAALQRKVVADQEQVERSSQISEAGIQYIVFLLNNEACTIDDLVANSPLVQTVTDADGVTEMGRYQLDITNAGDGVNVEAHGYSLTKPRRCQRAMANIIPAWASVGTTKYYINRQDFYHKANCAATVPAVTTLNCTGS